MEVLYVSGSSTFFLKSNPATNICLQHQSPPLPPPSLSPPHPHTPPPTASVPDRIFRFSMMEHSSGFCAVQWKVSLSELWINTHTHTCTCSHCLSLSHTRSHSYTHTRARTQKRAPAQ